MSTEILGNLHKQPNFFRLLCSLEKDAAALIAVLILAVHSLIRLLKLQCPFFRLALKSKKSEADISREMLCLHISSETF